MTRILCVRQVQFFIPHAHNPWQSARNVRTLREFMSARYKGKPENKGIAERLVALRVARGNPSQILVAQQAGVGYRSLQAYESGGTRPSTDSLQLLAGYYDTSPEWILAGDSASAPPSRLEALEAAVDEASRSRVAELEAERSPSRRSAAPRDRRPIPRGAALRRDLEAGDSRPSGRRQSRQAPAGHLSKGSAGPARRA